ncbi:Ig-like domain-containing protein [Actinoplanes sp. NPDC026623]|uniref:Ig-like domain-containing protein n=1 Tax=Actinoplanes sp. NPDC026623 TaxID=3155610 RepID=UPI0033E004A9
MAVLTAASVGVLSTPVQAAETGVATAGTVKVYARAAAHWVRGVTPVTFETAPGADLSAVTSLTVYANGQEIGTDTAAPWGIDWDTTGFDGLVLLSTRATTAGGSLKTDGFQHVVDNKAPTGLIVRFPRRKGYIGQGGELAVQADDNVFVIGSELTVGDEVVSSNLTGGNLDLPWSVKVPNGTTTMTVRVWDQAGNVTSQTRTVTVDNDRPVITGSTTAGNPVRGDFTISLGSYRDASPFVVFEASLDTATHLRTYGQDNSRTVTINGREVPDGKYTLGWHAFDSAGNEAILKRSLIVDNKPPAVSITKAPANEARVRKSFTVTATASDAYGVAKVQLLVNGKVVKTDATAGYSFTVNPAKYGKTFTVRVRAYDRAGNTRYSSTTRTYKR